MQDAPSDKGRRLLKQPPETRGGQATASKRGRGHPPSGLAQFQEPDWRSAEEVAALRDRESRAEREGGSGRLAPNRSRRLHDAGIAPRKLAQDAQP